MAAAPIYHIRNFTPKKFWDDNGHGVHTTTTSWLPTERDIYLRRTTTGYAPRWRDVVVATAQTARGSRTTTTTTLQRTTTQQYRHQPTTTRSRMIPGYARTTTRGERVVITTTRRVTTTTTTHARKTTRERTTTRSEPGETIEPYRTTTTVAYTDDDGRTITTVTDYTKAEDYDEAPEDELPEMSSHLIIVVAVIGGIIMLCFIYCCCCRKSAAAENPQGTKSQIDMTKTSTGKGRRKRGKKRGKSSASSGSSASSRPAVKAKKMEAEKINMMEFADKGALVMQDVKGEVKHALDDEKSGEILRVQYDTGQNEIVTIGSDIEIIKQEEGKSGFDDGAKSKAKSVAKGPKTMKKKTSHKRSVRH